MTRNTRVDKNFTTADKTRVYRIAGEETALRSVVKSEYNLEPVGSDPAMEMESSVGICDKMSAVELYDENTNVRDQGISSDRQKQKLASMSTAAAAYTIVNGYTSIESNSEGEIFEALSNRVEMEFATDRGIYTLLGGCHHGV